MRSRRDTMATRKKSTPIKAASAVAATAASAAPSTAPSTASYPHPDAHAHALMLTEDWPLTHWIHAQRSTVS